MNKFIQDGTFVYGGVAHRFGSDVAIQAYCSEVGCTNFKIAPDGEVTAEAYNGTRYTLGYTF